MKRIGTELIKNMHRYDLKLKYELHNLIYLQDNLLLWQERVPNRQRL
jgi:hypothetical protein